MSSFVLGKAGGKKILFSSLYQLLRERETERRKEGEDRKGKRMRRKGRKQIKEETRERRRSIFPPNKNSEDSLDKGNPPLINLLISPSLI